MAPLPKYKLPVNNKFLFEKVAENAKILQLNHSDQDTKIWLRDKASSVKTISPSNILKQQKNWTAELDNYSIGRMFLFNYDPKLKKELPYYDTWPLIFPFAMDKDGFKGLNLHYLPPVLRARFMDSLYKIINNDKMDDKTKLNLSYKLLKAIGGMRYFEPCIKKYLNSHVKSVFVYIHPKEWDYVLLLPLARFQKASQEFVWNQSRGMEQSKWLL